MDKIKFCAKCLAKLTELKTSYITDHDGNVFCDSECRRDYYIENKRDRNSNYEEWFGKDN